MFDKNPESSYHSTPTLVAPSPPIVDIAQQYVHACDHFESLMAQYHKINEELKQIDNERQKLREKLLQLINETIEPAPTKARYS